MAAQQAAAVKLNALKRVGNYSGDTDVERWVDRIELALRIDNVPTDRHADVIALHLEGAAYDTWKGLATERKSDAAAIKAELRTVFGLQRMDAWALAVSPSSLAPGDTVDVAFEELRKLVGIAAAGDNPVDRVAACLLTARLPPHVREQVLLQCGTEMSPTAVVACAKQLMAISSPSAQALSLTAGVQVQQKVKADDDQRKNRSPFVCYRCLKPGHFSRDCRTFLPNKSAVSGNAGAGQPQAQK